MASEYHLFIIWERAYKFRSQIVEQISKHFRIRKAYQITWDKQLFATNLRRFYRANLPSVRDKIKTCGLGPFTLLLVEDPLPVYEQRQTYNEGAVKVNINTFDAKTSFRKLVAEKSSSIHATNNTWETERDLIMLLGVDAKTAFAQICEQTWDGSYQDLQQDLLAANGWSNLQQLFYTLNHCCNYVVLRNFENLPCQHSSAAHLDIDLLTDDYQGLIYLTNAQAVFRQKYRVHHKVKIAGVDTLFDFRFVGDDYYDSDWQRQILAEKVLAPRGFYVPSPTQHFYSLLYHALVHKKCVTEEYQQKLACLWHDLGNAQLDSTNYEQILRGFMLRSNFSFLKPRDKSVYFNYDFLASKGLISSLRSFLRKLY